ncbi:hypothetical protein OH76DRAFT_1526069 [Lentinus brumalis]|uniref:Uncharacterized protein n=1 Tax=Lentinus brumalis TaxID=2498619 RepID=A0A371D4A0_9APHY|nr:hypothetical protein OH76DRAFT_1526069 [Polyporus brumalis]
MSTTTSSPSVSPASTPAAPPPSSNPSPTTRRAREPEDDGSVPEDDADTPRRKKARKPKKDTSFTAAGAAVGMMGDLFRDFQAILDFGLQFIPDTPQETMSSRDRKYLALYRHALSAAPDIVDEIAKRGPTGTTTLARELETGRSGVRGVDIHNIKKAVLTWNRYEPLILPEAKSVRGFNHPECGRLLCPPTYNWSDPEIRKALQNGSRKYPLGAKNWPRVLWLDEEFNRENPMDGFMRNRRLILTGRYSLLGPTACNASGTSKIPTKKPKAKIHRIRSISPAFIAYTAVIIHFSLYSQESFGDGATPGTFPYQAFYQSLVRYIEDTMPDNERSELVAWWTTQIFGYLEDEPSDIESGAEDLTVMGLMKKHAAARITRVTMATASG